MVYKKLFRLWVFLAFGISPLLFFQTPDVFAQATTITFNDLPSPNQPLNGQHPNGIVNWGNGHWYLSGPWGNFTTNSISFAGSSAQSASFSFLAPALLYTIDADNSGGGTTTITLSCTGNPTVTQNISSGQSATITTNWMAECTTVTIESSNGWSTNFDNLVYSGSAGGTVWNGHQVIVDGSGKLLSWLPQDSAYKQVMHLAWNYIKNSVPNGSNGVKHYLTHCCFYAPAGGNHTWYHNPAGLYAMFVDSLIGYYPYSGDASYIPVVKAMLDYQLANGTTPADWDWPNVPFASAGGGQLIYRGDGSSERDGLNGIQPDKVGELGHGYLMFWQLTGDTTYRDAAINAANALASHIRVGDETHSPWPFRVDGQTGAVREEYTSNAVAPVKLFDELIRLNLGQVSAYQTARNQAWNWVLAYPMQNNRWNAYFEDMPRDPGLVNVNQVTPMETARYILSHQNPATVDPNWQTNIPALLTWVKNTFGKGPYFGADAIDEQTWCCSVNGLGSHTARWASINALWYERTGELAFRENAYRSLNYATYVADNQGVVQYTFNAGDVWYTDGYADYIKHFMSALGAVPEWSPAGENHLVRSSSVVTSITYQPTEISFTTFDNASREVLRLAFIPGQVTVNGVSLPQRTDLNAQGWVFDPATSVLRIRHDNGTQVVVSAEAPPDPPNAAPRPNFSADGDITLTWNRLTWASGYEIQVDTDTDFAVPHYANNPNLTDSQLSFDLTGVPDGIYYWRVRAKDGSGVWRAWTPRQSFTVRRPQG